MSPGAGGSTCLQHWLDPESKVTQLLWSTIDDCKYLRGYWQVLQAFALAYTVHSIYHREEMEIQRRRVSHSLGTVMGAAWRRVYDYDACKLQPNMVRSRGPQEREPDLDPGRCWTSPEYSQAPVHVQGAGGVRYGQ